MEGLGEGWQNIKPVEFRADPGSDPAIEKQLKGEGVTNPDDAMTDLFDELMSRLDENPDDAEANRQAYVLVNRYDELARRLRAKIEK